jgi:hypothetical protein
MNHRRKRKIPHFFLPGKYLKEGRSGSWGPTLISHLTRGPYSQNSVECPYSAQKILL